MWIRHDMKDNDCISNEIKMRRRKDLKKSQEIILEYMSYVHLSDPDCLLSKQNLQLFRNYIQWQYSRVAPYETWSEEYQDEIDDDWDFIFPL